MPRNKNAQTGLSLIAKDNSKVLGVKVGENDVEPGQYIPRAKAQSPPEISFAVDSPSKTYLLVSLDLDAPFPSFGVLGPILHWIQPGLKPESTPEGGGLVKLNPTEPFVADYIGPAPPPGSSPHRYSFFLFEQPKDFDGKKYAPADGKNMGVWNRIRYDLDSWATEIKLGPVIACNYFTSN